MKAKHEAPAGLGILVPKSVFLHGYDFACPKLKRATARARSRDTDL